MTATCPSNKLPEPIPITGALHAAVIFLARSSSTHSSNIKSVPI